MHQMIRITLRLFNENDVSESRLLTLPLKDDQDTDITTIEAGDP